MRKLDRIDVSPSVETTTSNEIKAVVIVIVALGLLALFIIIK